MMSTMEPYTPVVDHDVSAVQRAAHYLTEIERRLAPYFERAEPRQRATAYLRGLLSSAERKNSWQLAEASGDATPYAFQHLLRRALWDPEAVRDELCRYVIQHLGEPEAVLVIDDTSFLKKGRHSAGVARQQSETFGKVENCQIGVFLGYASALGHALLDRELYLPLEWTTDRERCRQAGIPAARCFATKPQLAQQMLARAFTAGVPTSWVTGDSICGSDRHLRLWLESYPQAYVLAVSGQEYVRLDAQRRQVKTLMAGLPEAGWTRLGGGDRTHGPGGYEWAWRPLGEPQDLGWCRWLVVRRRMSGPPELTAYEAFARHGTTLEEIVRVAGTRWTFENVLEAAKRDVGLDHYEVRSWTGWYRHMTLAMWALGLLAVLRAGNIAVEALDQGLPPVRKQRNMADFKARRGLACR